MTIRIKWNHDGFRQLLQSDGVLNDLQQRAERIAAAAGEGFEVEVRVGATRAHARVYSATPDAMRAEETDHVLTRAIDAGRG